MSRHTRGQQIQIPFFSHSDFGRRPLAMDEMSHSLSLVAVGTPRGKKPQRHPQLAVLEAAGETRCAGVQEVHRHGGCIYIGAIVGK